jgi:hypothetical protein
VISVGLWQHSDFQNSYQESRIRELTSRLAVAEKALSMHRHSSSPVVLPTEEDWTHGSRISSTGRTPKASPDSSAGAGVGQDITDINLCTNTIEFHGGSSSVAILDQVQRDCEDIQGPYILESQALPRSLVSALHNSGFLPQAVTSQGDLFTIDGRGYFQDEAIIFMESYFDTLHYIHPIIDKNDFTDRSKELWISGSGSSSFMALYYSLLSLGALVRTWDEHQILGLTRFEWSQQLFQKAQAHLDEKRFSNDLDTVQALFLMVR